VNADHETASIIFAAGKGSRMKDYEGNKTLLPLRSGQSPFEGSHPMLIQILNCLPPGPKALVINYKKEDVIDVTRSLGLTYCEQPLLNGTGGALLASQEFLKTLDQDELIITYGDIPFVRSSTYRNMVKELTSCHLVVLGFSPQDKKQYGVLEIVGDTVRSIIEWKYWMTYSEEKQKQFEVCNSGVYAARKDDLIRYLPALESKPHRATKERNGKMVEVEEFFITDLVELMHDGGLKVGYVMAEDENEAIGVDDLPTLIKAQKLFSALQ
jgi:bifunctional UDP-N-acetylglucosamine pyrophosphorylase/glucosamine-1-phosphate N-acetyltransferase